MSWVWPGGNGSSNSHPSDQPVPLSRWTSVDRQPETASTRSTSESAAGWGKMNTSRMDVSGLCTARTVRATVKTGTGSKLRW